MGAGLFPLWLAVGVGDSFGGPNRRNSPYNQKLWQNKHHRRTTYVALSFVVPVCPLS